MPKGFEARTIDECFLSNTATGRGLRADTRRSVSGSREGREGRQVLLTRRCVAAGGGGAALGAGPQRGLGLPMLPPKRQGCLLWRSPYFASCRRGDRVCVLVTAGFLVGKHGSDGRPPSSLESLRLFRQGSLCTKKLGLHYERNTRFCFESPQYLLFLRDV